MPLSGAHILIVEDTRSLADMYIHILEQEGYPVSHVSSARAALNHIETGSPCDMVLLDVKLPDADGLDVLQSLNERAFDKPVLIMTGNGSVSLAVDAMRMGAADFLVKPFSPEKLLQAVASAQTVESQNNTHETETSQRTDHQINTEDGTFGGFIGKSAEMQLVYDVIESAAQSDATVFITGESGTGKEVCAEAIHQYSARKGKPFIPLNCAAIPRDLMESELFGHVKGAFTGAIADRDGAARLANGGTLFLDEIAEMAPDMQTKLLRFLQNLTFQKVGGGRLEKTDVRIICATNRDPLAEIKTGNFREDLYYRLHVIPVHMPPLRSREDDVLDIADSFLQRFSREEGKTFEGFDDEAAFYLKTCAWPGNVRQLKNVIQNVVVLNKGSIVSAQMLPPEVLHEGTGLYTNQHPQPANAKATTIPVAQRNTYHTQDRHTEIRPLWEIERDAIEEAITLCRGNIPKAAAMLDIAPSTIYRKKILWENMQKNTQIS